MVSCWHSSRGRFKIAVPVRSSTSPSRAMTAAASCSHAWDRLAPRSLVSWPSSMISAFGPAFFQFFDPAELLAAVGGFAGPGGQRGRPDDDHVRPGRDGLRAGAGGLVPPSGRGRTGDLRGPVQRQATGGTPPPPGRRRPRRPRPGWTGSSPSPCRRRSAPGGAPARTAPPGTAAVSAPARRPARGPAPGPPRTRPLPCGSPLPGRVSRRTRGPGR